MKVGDRVENRDGQQGVVTAIFKDDIDSTLSSDWLRWHVQFENAMELYLGWQLRVIELAEPKTWFVAHMSDDAPCLANINVGTSSWNTVRKFGTKHEAIRAMDFLCDCFPNFEYRAFDWESGLKG